MMEEGGDKSLGGTGDEWNGCGKGGREERVEENQSSQ